MTDTPLNSPQEQQGGDRPKLVRGLGVWTHFYNRGVVRFFRFWVETLLGPLVSTLLFMTVFTLALDDGSEIVPGLTALQFIAPGLTIFALSQIAFQNAAFMLIIDKHEGVIADILMAPLSPLEVLLGYALAAAVNGLIVAVLITLGMTIFTGVMLHSLWAVLFFAFSASLLFSMLGTIVGLWSDKWDQFAMADNFLMLPLGLLSGTFFTLSRVPEGFHILFDANPMFWVINGFRYGLTGYDDGAVTWQAGALLVAALLALLAAWALMRRGYKVKP